MRKKQGLDESRFNNFLPVSIIFVKAFGKSTFLNTANLLEPFQSGFTAHHSTESALLKVFNDILVAVDAGKNAVLILLDLKAAFDTVDHNVLICRLEHLIISGVFLIICPNY